MNFIEQIAPYIQKYAPTYSIKVCSPIIAQAVLESASGTSELAVNAHNYYGLKYRAGRCPTCCGIYYKTGSEQNADGSYTSSAMQWMKFSSMEDGVRGYFDFINTSNYANLRNVTDPKTYLENIKKDGYATSINYVNNLSTVITKYDLTKYDSINETSKSSDTNVHFTTTVTNKDHTYGGGKNKLKINVHAGHNPAGKTACGAVGILNESLEDRIVKDKVIAMLKAQGHTVHDCTVDNGTSQNDVLTKIVAKCNANPADLDVSIHFNSGANNKSGNGKTTGTEVFVYSPTSKANAYAQNIVNAISGLGFKNRGVKYSTFLYFLKKTKAPALLIECCFVDDKDDADLYNADKMAQAIVKGISGVDPITSSSAPCPDKVLSDSAVIYTHKDFVKEIQYAIGAKTDGIAGSETLSKTITVSKIKNNRHAVVKPIQKYLNSIGYDCGTADGIAGSKFDAAVKAFQRANGCTADGEITAGKNTWRRLLKL